jgi:hypothetical protein
VGEEFGEEIIHGTTSKNKRKESRFEREVDMIPWINQG